MEKNTESFFHYVFLQLKFLSDCSIFWNILYVSALKCLGSLISVLIHVSSDNAIFVAPLCARSPDLLLPSAGAT